MVRDVNIKVNVDVIKSANAIGVLGTSFERVGTTAEKTAMKVQGAMGKVDTAVNTSGNNAAAAAVKFQTMGQGLLNLSTAGVQTFTSISNLDRAYNRAKMASVGLDRATDLLNRKQFKLNEEIAKNGENTSKAILLTNELATARKDLTVKTEKLKIEEAAVLDVQLLFAANIMNVGVSSMMIMGAMLSDNTKAIIVNKLALVGNTIAAKLNALSKYSLVPASWAHKASLVGGTGALVTNTLATKAATLATKALTIALGPVGLIIMGISAALVAYETNFYGFKDAVNGFLGIQTEANEVVEEGTGIMNLQSDAVDKATSANSALSASMKEVVRQYREFSEISINQQLEDATSMSERIALINTLVQSQGGTLKNFR